MARSLRLGRIAGTPVSVEAGLAVLAALFVASLALAGLPRLDPEAALSTRLLVATVAVTTFLACILAHELGHAVAAKRHDVGVLGITLSLLGGYAKLERQAPTPRAEFSIAAAGPAVNLVVGVGFAGLAAAVTRLDPWPDWGPADLVLGSLFWLAGVNVVLALFNLIPAAPLDGGRVLTALLWRRSGDAESARITSGRAGLVFGAVLTLAAALVLLIGDWQGLVVLVVAVFLFTGARGEIANAAVRRRLQSTKTADLMVSDPPAVTDSLSVEQLSAVSGPGQSVVLPVVRWAGEPIGYVLSSVGADMGPMDRSSRTVGQLMQPSPEVARAWDSETVDTVLRRVDPDESMVVVVHEPRSGRPVGTLCRRQIEPLFRPPDVWGRDRTGPAD
jgi:Zn-dependent protease